MNATPIIALVAMTAFIAIAEPPATTHSHDALPRYQIVSAGELAVLLDVYTGETWIIKSVEEPKRQIAWVPLQRYTGEDGAKKWAKIEQRQRVIRAHRKRQAAERHKDHGMPDHMPAGN